MLCPIATTPFLFPLKVYSGSSFSISHRYLSVFFFFLLIMAILAIVLPHCIFDLHLPVMDDAEHFSCTYQPFVFLPWRNVCSSS